MTKHTMQFDDQLDERLSSADSKLNNLLQTIDQHIEKDGVKAQHSTEQPIAKVAIPPNPPKAVCLEDEGIGTIIWATGYDRSYPWLTKFPAILDNCGNIIQTHGATPEPGIYVVGMRFQTRANSHFIDGVGFDARIIANDITRANQGYSSR